MPWTGLPLSDVTLGAELSLGGDVGIIKGAISDERGVRRVCRKKIMDVKSWFILWNRYINFLERSRQDFQQSRSSRSSCSSKI